MTQPGNHIDDESLSALVDDQLTPAEMAQVQAHLASCSGCLERADELRSVAQLLRALPEVELPRDFSLGPRLLVDPPNVIRLRRWYAASRLAAASLAAVFVVLSVGTLYVDSRPGTATEVARPQVLSAPATAPNQPNAAPTVTTRSAASGAAAVSAQAPAAAPAAARAPAARPQADDQVAAATSTNPLPTAPPPTPTLVPPPPVPVSAPAPVAPADMTAPFRATAAIVGVLAALAMLGAFVLRHRLQHT